MPMIEEKRAVIAKIETTYGVDPVPTGAANAMLVKNLAWRPLEAGYASREGLALPFLGRFASKTAIKRGAIEFDVEFSGGGAAGTPPPYGALLRACGLGETVVPATSVTYAPVSSAFDSVAMYANIDGLQQKLLGSRGSVAIVLANEEIPVFRFRFLCLYAAPTDTALPALTLTGWQQPLPMNKTNTTPISLHGYACGLQGAELDKGNGVEHQSFPGGSDQVFLVTRRPSGRVMIEHPTMAQKDFFALVDSGATGAFSFTHGTAVGNKVAVSAAQARLTNPRRSSVRGIATLELDLELAPSNAGNDELSIVVT
jgi:hypothetical protein